MALPRRAEPEELGGPSDTGRRLRRRATGARLSWWWLWIVVVCLVIWWAVWGWGESGGWWRSSIYREGTNGGRVSEPMGQPTDQPTEDSTPAEHGSIGTTANPNTGVHRHAKTEGTEVTSPPNDESGNSVSGGSAETPPPQ
jgi:hypothetical protein